MLDHQWAQLAKIALIGAKHALRDAADGVADKAKTHAAADYIEAILDQEPFSPPRPSPEDAPSPAGRRGD